MNSQGILESDSCDIIAAKHFFNPDKIEIKTEDKEKTHETCGKNENDKDKTEIKEEPFKDCEDWDFRYSPNIIEAVSVKIRKAMEEKKVEEMKKHGKDGIPLVPGQKRASPLLQPNEENSSSKKDTPDVDFYSGNGNEMDNGQLISKGHFGVFKSTKNFTKFCKDFSPSL